MSPTKEEQKVNTLKEILDFESEFDEKFPENMGLAKVWRKEIKDYIHSRDKKLLMAVVKEIDKLKVFLPNKGYFVSLREGDVLISKSDLSSLLQDLIK